MHSLATFAADAAVQVWPQPQVIVAGFTGAL